ncbi:MAG TPA: peptide-methionine (S)-S-oxide reductase MsrA [Fimbriimonadaceae bacterium]|nr:peptide-methionine (S)-S-oxide reductase MsrA [Fimbriimonadaceae bacterium]
MIKSMLLLGLAGLAAMGFLTVGTEASPKTKSLVVAGGCYWCLEGQFEMLEGVVDVESGFAGGNSPNSTYAEVCTGRTGHAEVVTIKYDPAKISASDLLHIFFTIHDPTTLNRQGNDVGTQYRSAIFYSTEEEKALAERVRDHVAKEKIWRDPIVTTIEPLKNYIRAGNYHQDYFEKYMTGDDATRAGMNAGYCAAVIEPKVAKFRQKYANRLKKR